MTATAFANDPILDPASEPGAGGQPTPGLHVVTGPAGGGAVLAPVIPLGKRHQVEVYRRRRFLAAVIATLAILVTTQLAGVSLLSFDTFASSNGGAQVDSAPIVHIVRPGDTYGAIAATVGAESPAAFAEVLRRANGGAELIAGQRVLIDQATLASASS